MHPQSESREQSSLKAVRRTAPERYNRGRAGVASALVIDRKSVQEILNLPRSIQTAKRPKVRVPLNFGRRPPPKHRRLLQCERKLYFPSAFG